MTTIHLTNSKGRNATIGASSIKPANSPKMGLKDEKTIFRRFIASAETGVHERLTEKFGADYSNILIESDPEVDIEIVGQTITGTQTVFLDGDSNLIYTEPRWIELILDPTGKEKERREVVDTSANVNSEMPLRWSGRKIPIKDAVKSYVFKRQLLLRHVDGLTYDFLFEMAQDLEKSSSMMLVGSGDKGSGALIFQANGRAYRGFLHGKTKGKSYRLTLHLSDMELKKPADIQGGV